MSINSAIEKIYDTTQQKFSEWANSEDISFRNAACPESLRGSFDESSGTAGPAEIGDPTGFQILWTPISHKPKILICGLCPASFGPRKDNERYLKGDIPAENIYFDAYHKFGSELTEAFSECGSEDLFHYCVGLNVWHFQHLDDIPDKPHPNDVRLLCENHTEQIIQLTEPETILALGKRAFDKLKITFPSKVHYMDHPSRGKNFRAQLKSFVEGRLP
jgi:hypothetical protein